MHTTKQAILFEMRERERDTHIRRGKGQEANSGNDNLIKHSVNFGYDMMRFLNAMTTNYKRLTTNDDFSPERVNTSKTNGMR